MKNALHKWISQQKLRITAALLSVAAVTALLGSYAWFYNQRGLRTMTEVEAPYQLTIYGGNKTEITEIDLSGINLDSTTRKAHFVFCVSGTSTEAYEIELAHTTNVPFTYSIYKTTQKTEDQQVPGDILFNKSPDGKNYYYTLGESPLPGHYINLGIASDLASTTDKAYEDTYKAYGSAATVQKRAVPLYYLLNNPITPPTLPAGETTFYDYYILEVSWDESLVKTGNQKETDLVYLMAQN
ncbi:MAG: hypothetical protein PHO10_04705 [Gemmiger sp.]|nr:hypothetical protein [Gemmiger sp.]